jgi:hypothetical protein
MVLAVCVVRMFDVSGWVQYGVDGDENIEFAVVWYGYMYICRIYTVAVRGRRYYTSLEVAQGGNPGTTRSLARIRTPLTRMYHKHNQVQGQVKPIEYRQYLGFASLDPAGAWRLPDECG